MLENQYKSDLDNRLREMYPGLVILKNDANFLQGVPDRLLLHGDRWAMLEGKRSAKATRQPNQEYYVDRFNDMSFASFIYPENEEDVLNELHHAFTSSRRSTRNVRRQ